MEPREIKVFRARHGLNQKQLAGLLGVAPLAITSWETGKHRWVGDLLPLALERLEQKLAEQEAGR